MANEGFDYTDEEGHNYDDNEEDSQQEQQEQKQKQEQEQEQEQMQPQDKNKENKNNTSTTNDDDDYNELISQGYTVEGDARRPTLIRLIEGAIKRKGKNVPMKEVLAFCRNWNQDCCKPEPVSDEEFEECCNEVLSRNGKFYEKFFDGKSLSSSDSDDYRKLLEESFPELKGNIYYRINVNPAKFIVAFKATGHVIEIEASISRSWDNEGNLELERTTKHNRTFLMWIPDKITRHLNPFRDLETEESAPKHSIKFVDQKGEEHTFAHKTLAGIISILKDHNYIFGDGAEYALSAIILGFKQMGKLHDNNDVDVEGFFIEKKTGKIGFSKVDIDVYKEPNIADLTNALDFIDEVTKYYGENRLDLLSTSLIWGTVAPLIFMLKSTDYYLECLYLYGASNSFKTTDGRIILAIDRHHDNLKYALKFTSVDTVPKFANKVSKTTFPILIDEVSSLNNVGTGINRDRDKERFINVLKIAVDNKVVREKYERSSDDNPTPINALATLILTSEFSPPTHSAGFTKRSFSRHHSQLESKDPNDPEAIACKEFMRTNLRRLGALGDFRNWYIMNNQELILDQKKPPPLDIGFEILKKAYEYVKKPVPEWLGLKLPKNQLEEALQDSALLVKNALIKHINDRYARAVSMWKASDRSFEFRQDVSYRLKELGMSNLITDVKIKIDTKDGFEGFTAIIGRGLLEELYNQQGGITHDQCPHLTQLAEHMGVDKGRDGYHMSHGVMKIHINQKKLAEYFGEEE